MNYDKLTYYLQWYAIYRHVLDSGLGCSSDRRRARRGLTEIISWLTQNGVSNLVLVPSPSRPHIYTVLCRVGGFDFSLTVNI